MFFQKKSVKQFKEQGYYVYRNIYPVTKHSVRCPDLFQYAKSLDPTEPDHQSPGSPAYYNDIEMSKVMIRIMPLLERATGLRLFPTYNYFRNYHPMAILERHRDRVACEISCTLNIGYEGDYNWPIWVKDYQGNEHEVTLNPGDALIYRGVDLEHWREPSDGRVTMQSQVFLHYVDQFGPYANGILDIKRLD